MNLTKIRKSLADAAFDPRKPGTIQTIVGENTQDYLIVRAIEALCSARQSGCGSDSYLRTALSIIAAARVRGGP